MKLPFRFSTQNNGCKLAFDDGTHRIKYSELDGALADFAATKAWAFRQGTRVGWCPRNDRDAFLTFWTLQQLGCIACPISHRFPQEVQLQLIERLGAEWLPSLAANRPGQVSEFSGSHKKFSFPEEPATIVLSSGSTGVPKAIVHSMKAHVANARGAAENLPLLPGDRWLWSLPVCHISGLSILIRCALAGATVIGMAAEERLSAGLLRERQVTHLSMVNTQLRRLMRDEEFTKGSPLKFVLLGGSSVDPRLVARARQNQLKVITTYGLTEMASQVTTSRVDSDPACSGKLLDGRQLTISSRGEILVKGKSLCLGYLDNDNIQSVVDEAGWFHTGDLGFVDEHQQLYVQGRVDNMFVSAGENIYPEKIERSMLEAFEIEQAVVVPQSDSEFGMRPVVFVKGALPSQWQTILRERLTGIEIPVEIMDWPADAMGATKVNRQLLKRRVAKANNE